MFTLNKPLGDESIYYKRRGEDESIYLVARKLYWILSPHKFEKCCFVNLCGRYPEPVSLAYSQTLAVLPIPKLDIFWICDTSKIHGMLGYAKDMVEIFRETGRSASLTSITVWPVGDEAMMGVEIQIMDY